MKQDIAVCSACPYLKRGFVPGRGDPDARLMFIGEGPGQDESFHTHRPFTGPAGRELDRFLKMVGINREDIYITNVVKCNPPDNEDPKPEVIERCAYYLRQELLLVRPLTIIALGRIALHWFLPGASLEMVWGIPQPTTGARTIFPLYHPALGLHQTRMLPMIEEGFVRLGRWLGGETVWVGDDYEVLYLKHTGSLASLGGFKSIAVDTEATWDGAPLFIQLCGKKGLADLIDCRDDEMVGRAKEFLECDRLLTILHNAPYDMEQMHRVGIHPKRVEDTMTMAYLLGDMTLGLKSLAHRLCGMNMRSYDSVIGDRGQEKARAYLEEATKREWPMPPAVLEFKIDGTPHIKKPQNINRKIKKALADNYKVKLDLYARWERMEGREVVESAMGKMPAADLRDVPEQEAVDYACRDADATLRVYPILKKRISDEGLQGVLNMDMGVLPMVMDMMHNGITVNLKTLKEADLAYEREMVKLEREMQKLLGYKVNPRSTKQMSEMLTKEGIVAKKKFGKTKQQSTGVKVLEPLRGSYPVIRTALEYKKFATLRSMFTNTIPRFVGADGKVHTTIKTTRVITGRLATENPNLMAMPVRTEEGLLIRNAFEASPGFVLLSFDYSQIEMRTEAERSQDEAMLNVFRTGKDIHSETASRMFHLAVEKLDSMKHRYPAKRTGFGVLYGIGPQGLLDQMEVSGAGGWTLEGCEGYINAWLRAYPGVRDQMDEDRAFARRHGFIVDMWGRRRLIPELRSSSKKIVEEGLRYAINQPATSGAQGVIKTAMRVLWEDFITRMPAGMIRPLLQIHDDLLFEVREEEAEWVSAMIQGYMENVVRWSIPTPVDPKMGKTWGDMKKW